MVVEDQAARAPEGAPGDGDVPRPRARSARREATRERVLDAARQVFAERGVIGGTVEDICEEAGFTRGAFYSNFADKDDVLVALIAREHARLLAHVNAGFELLVQGGGAEADADADPVVTMAAIADRLLASVPADRQFSLVQTELEIHAVRDPETSRAFTDADARFRERIGEFLERGLRMLGRELVVDLDDATEAVIAIVERSTRRALLAGDGADPNALARTILPLVMAVASRPRAAAAPGGGPIGRG